MPLIKGACLMGLALTHSQGLQVLKDVFKRSLAGSGNIRKAQVFEMIYKEAGLTDEQIELARAAADLRDKGQNEDVDSDMEGLLDALAADPANHGDPDVKKMKESLFCFALS